MKKTFFMLVLLLPGLNFLSCKSHSQGNQSNDNNAVVPADKTASTSDASFSCKLDGKDFSAKGTDQNFNAAFRLTGDDKGQIYFKLADINDASQKLNFQLPAKQGQTTVTVSPTFSYMGLVIKGYINYLDNPLSVSINSINSERVSGTFSGKYTLSEGSGSTGAKQVIEVTDGNFDIPFSNSASWKKLYNAE